MALTKAYVVGSSVPLRLTEWMRPTEGVFVLARLCSAEVDVCVEHTGFEVVSSDPTVVRIDRTESGVVLRAIAPGVSRLDALHEGSPVTSVVVEVAQPERLELWMRGPGVLLPSHAAERVTRFVGGVLELQVRFYVGDRRFFGSSVARWETSIPHEMPTFSGNVVRIVDSEVGIERVRVVLGDLSAELEIRSVDTLDELFVVQIGDVDFDAGEPVWEPVLVATTKDGAPVRGLLPFRWSVDGADVEAGPWLQCRLERGAPSVVAVRLGGLETSVGLAGTCVEVRSWP
ncbi:MAG: hypothetical protein H6721_11500 [Sandaracinus sp.]|nr:hypothetical protein [Sandaracinus sp.]